MAPRGPLPSPDRQRRNAPTIPETELGSSPVDAALVPKIPRRDWQKLHKETRAWWTDIVGAPQASQYAATDWRRLVMVVLPIVEDFNREKVKPATKRDPDRVLRLADAIARHEKDFGLTPDSRSRLRWVVRPKASGSSAEESASPTPKSRPKAVRTDPRLALVEGGKGKS